ncbi:MAG: class I SAM-dependent methyltransferase [Myxococcales bacterium]|nr:class I SAM-dependent methyltransferase [Myxococcales bacterium]
MQLTRELSRKVYVQSRLARTLALRTAYIAYARALLRWSDPPTPEAAASLRARIGELFEEDWQDAENGLYPRELIEQLPWREYAQAVPRLLADLPRTRARIGRGDFGDVPNAERYPHYYARNFHYQTEGYLGHTSAVLYDLQVELLFGGTADTMRRRLIPPVVRFAREAGASKAKPIRVLDVACGTGHFLRMLGAALPEEAKLYGLDLSPHYIARAREVLPRDMDVSLICDNAEHLPFLDGSFDVATSVFLLHEVPADVRERVLSEMARVVRPGGLVVVADSIQLADAPELKREILGFPNRFHEPYYLGYVKDELATRIAAAGLRVTGSKLAFLTKIVTAEKAAAPARERASPTSAR